MAYSAPNYNLMSTYINDIADSRMNGRNEMGMDDLLQARYFDRNGLRGSRGELSNQLKDIMAQTDYGKVPHQSRPTIVDKLNEGDPQDKLNDKQCSVAYSPHHRQGTDDTYDNQRAINPDVTHGTSYDNRHRQEMDDTSYDNHHRQGTDDVIYDNHHRQGTDDTYDNQSSTNPYTTHGASYDNHRQGSINCKHQRGSQQKYNIGDWSLTKTIVIVIILVGIFYLLLTIMFQDRVNYQAAPGNMNLPGSEMMDTVNH